MLRAACSQSQPQQHNRTLTRSSRVAPTPRDVKESSHQTVDANPTVSNGYCQQRWRGWLAHSVHHTPGVALPHQPSELHNTCKQMAATHRDTKTLDACSPHWWLRQADRQRKRFGSDCAKHVSRPVLRQPRLESRGQVSTRPQGVANGKFAGARRWSYLQMDFWTHGLHP